MTSPSMTLIDSKREEEMTQHDWVKSTLGHGETMCRRCYITNREAAALGCLNHCDYPETGPVQVASLPAPDGDGPDQSVGVQPAGHPPS
jgi:hypothetical protein